jgi:hypothetical protein
MKELFRRHHAVFLEHHSVLHHKLHVAQSINVGEGIAGNGDGCCPTDRPAANRAKMEQSTARRVFMTTSLNTNFDFPLFCRHLHASWQKLCSFG